MTDLNQLIKEKFQDDKFIKDYYREATYYRLADQLLLLRKKRGLTQKELAEKMDTTQTVVSRLENVSVKPSLETVIKAAEAMDAVVDVRIVPLEQARRFEDESSESSEDDDRLELIKNLVSAEP